MNKSEFLNSLEEKLKELPKDEIRKTIDYYDEMIDDRIEDGMTEEEAVKSISKAKKENIEKKLSMKADRITQPNNIMPIQNFLRKE